ncbi:hypothetical protein [Roseateles sp.]|uniref:hypothetical protein n=1 Tax=Roseateles sp. TaxID=1971397 RepID=UPI003BAD981A
MPSLSFASALSLLALLAACAAPSAGDKVAASDAAQADVVCFFEAPTGTNRKVRRCMSKEEYNKASESAQRIAGEIRTPPPPPQ